MSIATAIQSAQGKVANAYTAVSGKGGTLPATQDLSNLPAAINSIQVSSGSLVVPKFAYFDYSGVGSSRFYVYENLLFSGTSHGSSYSNALNYSNAVTVTSGTYTLWCERKKTGNSSANWTLLATITL